MTSLKTLIVGAALTLLVATGATAANNLANRHVARGTNCVACHNTKTPKAGATVDTAKCASCHGSLDKVAQRTKAKKLDPDPHYNHLVGLNCNECHKGHQKSVNLCSQCHNLEFKVP